MLAWGPSWPIQIGARRSSHCRQCRTRRRDRKLAGGLAFAAPELIRGTVAPSAVSDLHTLAVLLYYLLMHGHPLMGRRTRDELHDGHLGTDPLFVFDPADTSKAPEPEIRR
jgi:hypothetical protein